MLKQKNVCSYAKIDINFTPANYVNIVNSLNRQVQQGSTFSVESDSGFPGVYYMV